jgi:predicted XRE-type DNA-binding protein
MNRSSLFELATNDPVELNSLILKSKLSAIVRLLVKDSNWSQAKVAEVLKTTQPRVSNLLNGKLSKFSVDFLLESLCRLGYKLNIDFDPTDLDEPMQMALKKAVL